MKVNEIFTSIEGEGIRTGLPSTFVRFCDCNMRCPYCDTTYSYINSEYVEMNVEEILDRVLTSNVPRVTLTGGEPLLQTGICELIDCLEHNNIDVNVETNGSIDLDLIFQKLKYTYNVMFTMDWKSTYYHLNSKMIGGNLELLREKDVIKFVVADKCDLDVMKDIYLSKRCSAKFFVSPVFGQIDPKDIVKYVLDNKLNDIRVQVQLHKIIWDSDERGV